MQPDFATLKNRQWLLAKRPEKQVSRDCFAYQEGAVGAAPDASKSLIRMETLLCAPTIRNWISGNSTSFYPTIAIGQPIMAPTIATVVYSPDPAWPAGARVFGVGSWQDYQWVDLSLPGYRRLPDYVSSVDGLGLLGSNGLTAYFGLTEVGKPMRGETLLVSGAAGSVGSTVSQIGRIKGCRVIGICGGEEKRRWLVETCGIEHVIDYKSESVAERIDAIAPDGVDIFFDNVGGSLLGDAIARIRRYGRIVLCGQISSYDSGGPAKPADFDVMRLIYGHVRIEGFLASDYRARFAEGIEQLRQWRDSGLLAQREDVRPGLANLPETFASLFDGSNMGTLIARVADETGQAL